MTPSSSHTTLTVAEKTVEADGFATLFFDAPLPFVPGQFVMVWIPGVDEKPYTLSYWSDTRFGITIEAKGRFSKKAMSLEKGDLAGIRGPFGNGFSPPPSPKQSILVAGGCGMAPLAVLAEQIRAPALLIQGARTRSALLYPGRFDLPHQACTDDGSAGHAGMVTDLLIPALEQSEGVGMVYACGPEIMMHRVFEICQQHRITCEVSLERYMRCGFGVCGACVCGQEVVCKDGPVFDSKKLAAMADFNRSALLKSGKAVPLAEYTAWRHPQPL